MIFRKFPRNFSIPTHPPSPWNFKSVFLRNVFFLKSRLFFSRRSHVLTITINCGNLNLGKYWHPYKNHHVPIYDHHPPYIIIDWLQRDWMFEYLDTIFLYIDCSFISVFHRVPCRKSYNFCNNRNPFLFSTYRSGGSPVSDSGWDEVSDQILHVHRITYSQKNVY